MEYQSQNLVKALKAITRLDSLTREIDWISTKETAEPQHRWLNALLEQKIPVVFGTNLATRLLERTIQEAAHTIKHLATILFTSGSTGHPKAVPLTAAALLGNALATQSILNIRPGARFQTAMGFQFISTLSHFLVASLAGAKFFTTHTFLLKKDLAQLLIANQITHFGGSPLQLRWIAEAAADHNFSLEWLMSSGDHLPQDTIQLLKKNLPRVSLYVAYGLTEVSGRFCILSPDDNYSGSVGKPIPGMALHILNEEGIAVKPYEIGQIYAEGDYVFPGYAGQDTPELKGNRFKTGDLGYQDEQGYVYLAGRSDTVFKCAGIKVSTFPITEILMQGDYFKEVVVISVPDEILGQVPAVFYVLKSEKTFDRARVLQQLRKHLPAHSIPQHFIPLSTLPRTGSGKPDYAALKTVFSKSSPELYTI